MGIFINIFALVVTLPLLAWILIYWVSKLILKDQQLAIKRASDVTMFLLVFSVDAVMHAIWGKHFFGWIILFLLVTAGLFTYLYWNFRDDFDPKRILRGVWRFNFLIFATAFILLFFYGLITSIAHGT